MLPGAGNVVDATPRLAAFAAPQAAAPISADGARAVRAAGLQDRLTFDSFIEGQGNAFALAIAKQVASWADGHFNPVFFCGPLWLRQDPSAETPSPGRPSACGPRPRSSI